MIRASLTGGSGYVGGELLRLLLGHPGVEIAQAASASRTGKFVHTAHPNLRGVTDLKFTHPEALEPCDVLFLCEPHGKAAGRIETFASLAKKIVDLSADFRLESPAAYEKWYGWTHPAPDWLPRFTYGLPEFFREELKGADYASGVGCNATVTNLALAPLARSGLLERAVVEVKVGSSEAGARPTEASHHPERAQAVRPFKLAGHRHQAEVRRVLGEGFELHFSVTSVPLVRGAAATAHCFLTEPLEEKDLWKLYRSAYGSEPFVRLVAQKTGIHRYPEPALLAGTNFCDVGFAADPGSPGNRVVVTAALDNLVKGAAGSALQCMNLMTGLDEGEGLSFPGLHPL